MLGLTGTLAHSAYSANVLKAEIDALKESKQNTLVSGATIKTINGQSVLGAGNIAINQTANQEPLYFIPHIDEHKVLTWTNNGGLLNPAPIDLNPFDLVGQDGKQFDPEQVPKPVLTFVELDGGELTSGSSN